MSRTALTRRGVTAIGLAAAAAPALAASVADGRFEALGKRYIEHSVRTSPTSATTMGDHRFDTLIDDLSAAGRAKRIAAAIPRIQALPVLFAQCRAALVPARVPLVHAQTVARQNPGVLSIIDQMILPHAVELSAADQARLKTAVATAKAAVAEQQT